MINSVVLMGRIVNDLELKTTQSGLSVVSFRIAVDRKYSKGEKQTDFFDVVAWETQAEFICRYFRKGSLIALEGELRTRSFQTKDGANRTVTEVLVNNVSFTGERNTGERTKDQIMDDLNAMVEDDLP